MASLVVALALVWGAAAAGQQVPPLPKLPLETYEAGMREPIAEAYRSAQRSRRTRTGTDASGCCSTRTSSTSWRRRASSGHTPSLRARDPWAYYLGRAQVYLAQSDAAAASLREALRLRPGYLPARLMLAKSLLDGGHADESRALYQSLVNELPETAEAHYGLGRIAAARGELASAVEHSRACALFPGFGAAHFALARAYRDRGETEKAREQLALYQKDKLGWPTVPDPLLAAILDLKTGANARLRKGIQLAEAGELGGRRGARAGAARRSEARAGARQPDPALRDARSAREGRRALPGRGRDRPEAWPKPTHNYAYLLMTSGKLDDAAQQYRAAIEGRPDYRTAHFNLGRILVQQGKIQEAIEHLRKTLAPDDEETPRCTYALGAAYARAGNRDQALKYLQEARQKATARGQSELLTSIERDLRVLEPAHEPR